MSTDVPMDHSGLRVLGTDECLQRIRATAVGRVAFTRAGEVILLPVHHVVRGMEIFFRTSGGSKIEAAADHDPMGFEVDDYDAASATGWSVTASGVASLVDEDELTDELEALDGPSWSIGDSSSAVWVRIRPNEISGREIVPA